MLSVNESFIIEYTCVKKLLQVIGDASAHVVGLPIAVSLPVPVSMKWNSLFGLDFIAWVQAPRSPAFLE